MKTKIITLILFCFLIKNTKSQIYSNQVFGDLHSPSAMFLLIPPDAVAAGMASSGVAADSGLYAEFYNPAQTTFVKGNVDFTIGYCPWLRALVNDISYTNLSLKIKLNERNTINLSYINMSYGTINMMQYKIKPAERAFGISESYLLTKSSSIGLKIKYIQSNNLANSYGTMSTESNKFHSLAFGLSYYHAHELNIFKKAAKLKFGVSLDNVGNKIGHDSLGLQAFIPTILRAGQSIVFNLSANHTISLQYDVYKLLTPSPPVYKMDSNGKPTGEIISGENPDKPVFEAMINSFYDAQGGFDEEIREINYSAGMQFGYMNRYFFRSGYFHQSPSKEETRYIFVGGGLKYSARETFEFAFAYLIPIGQRNPLENTVAFSVRVN